MCAACPCSFQAAWFAVNTLIGFFSHPAAERSCLQGCLSWLEYLKQEELFKNENRSCRTCWLWVELLLNSFCSITSQSLKILISENTGCEDVLLVTFSFGALWGLQFQTSEKFCPVWKAFFCVHQRLFLLPMGRWAGGKETCVSRTPSFTSPLF